MNQLQFNGKTSTKRPNSSASSYGAEAQKKTRLVSRKPRLILPKPVLTEPQPQNIILQPQQQQQSVLSEPPQHQQQSQLQKQKQRIFPSQHPPFQEQYQIPHLSSTLMIRNDDKISQPKKTSISKQSKKKDDDDKDQEPIEKSGWKNSEIEILLDYLQENFTSWSKGNKTKFYNNMVKNILPNKDAIAIKNKIAHLIRKYESVKKYNNQSEVERKDWEWYDMLDIIFETRENISPSFLANNNKSTDIIETKKVNNKKQKNKNNYEVMTEAITEMNQTREKIWEQKMMLERKN
ncbi:unnamed protein product [Rhizophagus irregularis]|uniref:Uncharacterized protein n=1 Tax=Rhizophagus irregularis TaxID=588596 RepID=A0A2I1GE01_9GLOM|nr:hypothetical protein RhiirA4_542146 [Rhizophagus irregularis]CAB4403009.1 unnamed protein product [Rhizophagus irregularis]